MRKLQHAAPLVALILLAGCGQKDGNEVANAEIAMPDVAEGKPPPKAITSADLKISEGGDESTPVKIAAPQIAYNYTYGYELDADNISTAQTAHVALCDKLGTSQCRIVSMKREARQGSFSSAALSLQVDAKIARGFGDKLDAVVTEQGGDAANREITAEDLSKQLVDTEARIKAKQALADRLIVLLKNRSGKVGELVEAERAFADAQEELDAARTWLGEMQQRVSMSKIDINYDSYSPVGGGLWQPIREAFASVGQSLGGSVASAITFVVVVLPWIALLWGILWLLKRLGWIKQLRFPWPSRWRRPKNQGADS